MRENGTISPFGVYPVLYSIFESKLDMCPLKRNVFLESRKGHFGGRKGQMLRGPNWGLFCPEIRAFTRGLARFLQLFPKSSVTVKYYSNT